MHWNATPGPYHSDPGTHTFCGRPYSVYCVLRYQAAVAAIPAWNIGDHVVPPTFHEG